MFRWLKKNPIQKMERDYAGKLAHAAELQRNGDLIGYSAAIADAAEIMRQIETLEAEQSMT